jgi:hypothetical protein
MKFVASASCLLVYGSFSFFYFFVFVCARLLNRTLAKRFNLTCALMHSQIFIFSVNLFSAFFIIRSKEVLSFSRCDSHFLVAFVEKPRTVKCSYYPLRKGQQCSHPEQGLLQTAKKEVAWQYHGKHVQKSCIIVSAWFEHGCEASNTLSR